MKLRFTDAAVRSLELPPGKTELLIWDEAMPGLALRVGRQRRAWAYVYRPSGAGRKANPRKIGLGAWPSVSVTAARHAAQIEAGRVAKGEDPALVRREAKRRDTARVSAALDAYEAALGQRRYANSKSTMRTLRKGLAGFRDRDAASLTRNDLVGAVERVEAEGKFGAAADLRKHARTFLEWMANRGLVPFNVLAGLRRERSTRAQRLETDQRGKALTDKELVSVWEAASSTTVFGRYIRGLILTGCRRAELSRLERWMDRGHHLALPSSHTKQGRSHDVPVPPALREVLDACPATNSKFYFPSPKTGGEMSGWNTLVAKLRKTSKVDFTLHDLRRTMRSGLSRLGVDHDTAELMLGHQRDDLVRRYNKDARTPLRNAAAEKWAGHVLEVVEAAQSARQISAGA